MTLYLVGLGPGDPRYLTEEAAALLRSGLPVLVRTRHHPTVEALDAAGAWASCDDLYASAPSFDAAYEAIVARVLERAQQGSLVFAVPGHPLVAERAAAECLRRGREAGLEVRIVPGLSYVDLAIAELGISGENLQVCDALDLRIDCQRPALIGQVYSREVAGLLKIALLDLYPAEHRVTVLSRLGTAEAAGEEVVLAELDHQPFGYLACVFVPPLPPEEDLRRFDGLYAIVSRLHAPDGCPWDREQTHESLKPHLLEEAYEVLDAIDAGDPAALAEELGDLLLQVLMHEAVARRLGEFAMGDITESIGRKLIRRHPHVFGSAKAETAEDVRRSWEELKQAERGERSILEGIPRSMPALAASQTMQGRARRIGFDWPDFEGPLEKLVEELRELAASQDPDEREDEFGDVLFVLANIAQRLGIDAEAALRRANEKFRQRFGKVEELARRRGLDLRELDLPALDALWEEAKRELNGG